VTAPPPRRNVELKARDHDPERSTQACRELGAVDHGVLWQRDTYFGAGRGRLKLREQNPGAACLIQYERADESRQRTSAYRIAVVSEPVELVAVLEASLGIELTVTKRRRLFLWQSVRIHLDDVDGLGTFIELEAVAPPESDLTREHELVVELRRHLRIGDESICAEGYAQMLASERPHAAPAASTSDLR
jgi:adenylate cyclase, class 2